MVSDRSFRPQLWKYNDLLCKAATRRFNSVESMDVTDTTVLWWLMNILGIYSLTHYYSRRTAGIFVQNTTESQIPGRQQA